MQTIKELVLKDLTAGVVLEMVTKAGIWLYKKIENSL